MTDIRAKLQSLLDNALNTSGAHVFWLRKSQTSGKDPDEYAIYTLEGDAPDTHADDMLLLKVASGTVRYFYRGSMLDTKSGRDIVKGREVTIAAALRAEGFSLPNGSFDAGDIDDIGFGTIIFNWDYWQVV